MKQNFYHSIDDMSFLLKKTPNCDIVILDSVYEIIMSTKREEVKKIHPYAITPPTDKSKRWQTHYKDKDGKRKGLRASTEEDLLDKLVKIYYTDPKEEAITFYELYEEWLVYKRSVTNSPNTIIRHQQHYKKYFESSCLHNMKLSKMDELLLEQESNRIVREYNLSRKEWGNIKTILNGMFQYAYRKKYIFENPMEHIKILVKFRQIVKKTGKTETYNSKELEDLNRYLDAMFVETNDSSFLAVKLNFLLGLRVGELVALKWSDITDKKHIHIVREEVRDQENNKYIIVEHTKTNTDRYVVLVSKALKILESIEKTSEFIFTRNGERLNSRQIAYVLEKYAERQGLPVKSTHKMRKTYASNLNANNVPLDAIREQLGHSELTTTLSYLYNPLTEEETFDLIEKAL